MPQPLKNLPGKIFPLLILMYDTIIRLIINELIKYD